MPQSALNAHIRQLREHRSRIEKIPLKDLFDVDPQRVQRFSVEDGLLIFDFSKNRIDQPSLNTLLDLATEAKLQDARCRMFAGEKINFTEKRAVLHTALRAGEGAELTVDGENVRDLVASTRERTSAFAEKVRSGEYQLAGRQICDVVNIGIGGSDLGPVMCVAALKPYCSGPDIHFVSNVDGADFHDTVADLDPHTTLFIIASKSFTTAETMANAKLAKDWLASKISPPELGKHFVALSTNLPATAEFGIDEERTFGFWDWVGGRYSIWSSIGLSLMIAIGPENYRKFLDGAKSADSHFLNRAFENNIPVLMALIGIWHRNVWEYPAHAILPYDNRLSRFPAYLQQLDMESNGKHICVDGTTTKYSTSPVIWGEPGTNGQHAFYQLLHQGSDIVPCDFLIAALSHEKDQTHQRMLAANCFAQSEAMMLGRSKQQVISQMQVAGVNVTVDRDLVPHKVFEGNRPSSTIMYRKLDPFVLGQLIAFYEHKVFVQGVIWGINSFDQWGVELGKQLAVEIQPLLEDGAFDPGTSDHDASTSFLISKFFALSK
ncbi:MAG: glucose-6-phosphate isomerase [Hyphomicrobiales bacterium]|nr:glucose-6-phosphate isomerase [Hyphomicrobiales bacterium]